MSNGFLERWSRRKIEAKERPEAEPASDKAADGHVDDAVEGADATDEAAPVAPDDPETLSDEEIAALPSIESFTAATDLAPFLRRGVPMALRNAAMRRMWLLDPVISAHRDVAVDYAWDWNIPGGVPGNSGRITSEATRRMLDALSPPNPEQPEEVSEVGSEHGPTKRKAPDKTSDEATETSDEATEEPAGDSPPATPSDEPSTSEASGPESPASDTTSTSATAPVNAPRGASETPDAEPVRRRHGGARPA
ncbi:MAG: DUF3306 domain-containing protein [Salinarimonadaceae bacterium]|nr:MAG: DUF3306 domain-containing protein [Salinarimonadaceae bacterium]